MFLALEFPPVSELVEWPALFLKDTPFEVNKVVLLTWLAAAIVFVFFWRAGRSQKLVPSGLQNAAESGVEFIRNDVILQTIGPEGMGFAPFLTTMFFFIFFCNIFGIIPGIQMPVNARIAVPAFLAFVVWVLYNFVGIRSQGLGGYLKSIIIPPGLPGGIGGFFLKILVAIIEVVSTIFVRPFSLAVRLFANLLAGHLLLVSFAVIATALFDSTIVGAALPAALLVALTAFEILVAVLQAFIFTILTAVYIGGAMHPEH